MSFLQNMRGTLGVGADLIGTRFKLPEIGLSERLAGQRTTNTGMTAQSQAAGYLPPINSVPLDMRTQTQYGPKMLPWADTLSANAAVPPMPTQSAYQAPKPTMTPEMGGTGGSGSTLGVPSSLSQMPAPQPTPYGEPIDVAEDLRQKQALAEQQRLSGIENVRGGIGQEYGNQMSFLQGMEGTGLERRERYMNEAEQGAGLLRDKLGAAREGTLGKLNMAREGVGQRVESGARGLAENLRQMMRSAQQQFSAAGAGDSSATEVMAPYAFSKLGNQGRAQLQTQANEQYNQIDMQEAEVEQEYGQRTFEVEQWLGEQKSNIENYVANFMDKIAQEKRSADQNRLQALNGLEQSLLEDANNRYNAYQQQATDFTQRIQEWATNSIMSLEQAKIQLSENYGFDPREITTGALEGGRQVAINQGALTADSQMSPLEMLKRREEEEQRLGY